MTIHQDTKTAATKIKLLNNEEQAVCKQVANGAAPDSQRAVTLLAVNEGATQAQAAEKSGLSAGQVKYWVNRFKRLGLSIFPDTERKEVVAEAKKEQKAVSEPETVPEVTLSAEPAPESKKAKKTRKKDSKKNSKKDKKKDGKKDKKKDSKKDKKKTKKKAKKK